MKKYYTRVCNFYYGSYARNLIKKKKALPLNGNLDIAFDHVEILSRKKTQLIHFKDVKNLTLSLKKKIKKDLIQILKRKKNFSNLNFKKLPNIMGVINLTPDSFSDGGKFNKKNLGYRYAIRLYKLGSDIIDIGGESTRPMSKEVKSNIEWKRIMGCLKKLQKKKYTNIFRY